MRIADSFASAFKLAIFCIVFVAACPFYGQNSAHRLAQVIQKSNNTTAAQLVPYAKILICTDDTACAGVPVYQDANLTTPFVQPLTADGSGNYSYYVAPGCYKEQILSPGIPVRFISGVCLASPSGSGSVTSVAISTANGFSGTVTNPTSNADISLNVDGTHYLPLLTDQTNWNSKQSALGFTPENAAKKNVASGYAGLDAGTLLNASQMPGFTGDATSTSATTVLTLATVNSGPGSCGDATHVCSVTTNGKGLVTGQTPISITSGGVGTVTTFSAGTLSPLFTTAVANPTSTPALTFSPSGAAQNAVLAGPITGGAGVYSFRSLVAADIPSLPYLADTTQLPVTKAPVTSNFLTGYTSSTGLFSAAQAAFTDISGVAAASQLPVATPSNFGAVKPDGTSITVAGGVISASRIANILTTVGTTAIAANTCSSTVTVTMTGVVAPAPPTPGSVFVFTDTADNSAVTGWGSSGGLIVKSWPTTDTLNYKVCNTTGTSITPSASVSFDVGAR